MKTLSQNTLSNSTSLLRVYCDIFSVTQYSALSDISGDNVLPKHKPQKRDQEPCVPSVSYPQHQPLPSRQHSSAKENTWDSAEGLQFFKNSLFQSKLLKEVGTNVLSFERKKPAMLKKGLDSAGTLPPFTLHVVQRCVCFEKCEQTFVIVT